MIEDTRLFELLNVLRRVRGGIAPVLARHGLHPGQELLLSQLWRQDGLTHGQLVARLRVQPPTVTKALQRLEAAGFVRREAGEGYGRRVYLTDEGRDLRFPVEQAWADANQTMLDRLEPEQLASLGEILSRLTTGPSRTTPTGT